MKNLQDHCPACGGDKSKVYCTPLDDSYVRALLKKYGRSEFAGPVHRVDVGKDS